MKMLSTCLASLLIAAPAWAINKCVVDGKTIYQDAPCEGKTKVGEVNLSGAGTGDPSSEGAQYARRLVREAEMRYLVVTGRMAIGMTADQAREAWGDPARINRSVGSYGTHDQWVYRGPRGRDQYVYLQNGKVTGIQGPGD